MKLRRWLFALLILSQVATSGCSLFNRRDDCCGERRGLFGFGKHRSGNGTMSGMECCTPCSSSGHGDFPGMTMAGPGPMMVPAGAPDERLGVPAANRPWDGQGSPPAQLPKNAGSR
jgi:hypothetical protein